MLDRYFSKKNVEQMLNLSSQIIDRILLTEGKKFE